ncbi:hypothetical protein B5X24_HaOG215268 [Helicoverpa armigera]|nr:hypothetical protein B5X24_HaOG215268 [Helicoverpa armigera]
MKYDFCGNSATSKPNVLSFEYDGDILCFELDLKSVPPPATSDIVFPCCVKEKSDGKIGSNLTKLRKTDIDKRIKSKNIKRDGFKESLIPLIINMVKPLTKQDAKHDCYLYVIKKQQINNAINFTKDNIKDADTSGLQRGTSENSDRRSPNRKKPNTFMKLGTTVRASKSRELRGGILSTDCFCLRRNGLQYDCRRTGCQNNPQCSVLPAPICEPSRVACIAHFANPHAEELSSICKLRPSR